MFVTEAAMEFSIDEDQIAANLVKNGIKRNIVGRHQKNLKLLIKTTFENLRNC